MRKTPEVHARAAGLPSSRPRPASRSPAL